MSPALLRRPRHAFTLIELLTVIAIIGVLAAIVIASVGKVRQTAQLSRSSANVRQLALATLLYADANRGRLPKATVTINPGGTDTDSFLPLIGLGVADLKRSALYSYVGQSEAVFLAPTDQGLKANGTRGRNFSYTFNFLINKGELPPGSSTPGGYDRAKSTIMNTSIDEPSRKVIVFEEVAPNDAFCVWFTDLFSTRYGDRSPFGFADGHVQALPNTTVFANSAYCELLPPSRQY